MELPVDPIANLRQQFLILQQDHQQLKQDHSHLQQQHAHVLHQLSIALQSNATQAAEILILKDEIARLKGVPPRPKLPPNRLEGSGGGASGGGSKGSPGRGKHPRKNKTGLSFHAQERLKPNNIPEDAVFKGTRKYDIQNLICQAYNTRYLIERWQLRDGTYIEGQLPSYIQGHYGAELRAHVLMLAYSARVSEELILEQLHRYKIAISAGQLHAMLTEGHDNYHTEKEGILKAALESGRIQTEGTRSDDGRRAWDTFGSLNLTCRRLGICFYEYLMDRFLDLRKISHLGDIVRNRVRTSNTQSSVITEAMKMLLNTA